MYDPLGAWVAQSVERPTLDFGSGRDPRAVGLSPVLGSVLIVELARDSLSLSLCPSPQLTCSPSLKEERGGGGGGGREGEKGEGEEKEEL